MKIIITIPTGSSNSKEFTVKDYNEAAEIVERLKDRERAIEILNDIKKICNKWSCDNECPFANARGYCFFSEFKNNYPEDWNLEELNKF